jgi:carboxyl-terminal processing protease
MARRLRSIFLFAAIVVAFSYLGGRFGADLQAAINEPDLDLDAPETSDEALQFQHFYNFVERNFATPIRADKAIYDGAIPGMLATLDPHTVFFDPRAYRQLLDEQKGRYFGVGMEVGPRNNKTVVLAPFPGSPAYHVGLRPGDVLVSVNDKPTDRLNTTEIADLLKGPRGTPVKIVVSREGVPDYMTFTVVREVIERKSVPDGFFVAPDIAYIKIASFDENTSRELEENLRRLGQDRFHGLILDLRDNPGGILNEAVEVSGAFLRRGSTVVSARGREYPPRTYTVRNGSHGREYPIVVLVNPYSASAAEIVSGALQDHDRAWIMGQTTFGKGLVQSVMNLPEGTGIALTTAHFYTPSGRLIQRDYAHQSFFDYRFHKDGITRNPNDVKMTDSGRTVYGGGGITPDQEYRAPMLDALENQLFRAYIFQFARRYFTTHSRSLPGGWMPDAQVLADLRNYLREQRVAFDEATFDRDQAWIKRDLAKEMYVYAFNVYESDKIFAKLDPEVKAAIEAMPKAQALVQNAKRVMAERRQ